MGIGLFFFFFPFCMFSHLLLAYLKHFPCRILTEDSTCSSISGEKVRLGSFRDSLGWLSISTPRQIYYSPLQKILHSRILPLQNLSHSRILGTSFCPLLLPFISRPNNNANVCRQKSPQLFNTLRCWIYIAEQRICKVQIYIKIVQLVFPLSSEVFSKTQKTAKGIDCLFARLNTRQNKP